AVVWGMPRPRAGEIAGPIGRHPVDRKRMAVVARGGKPALTHYRVIEALGLAASLVDCRLATGRTHQIRVHLASIGHPLLGDPVYGRETALRRARLSPAARAALASLGRQALHAQTLGFRHPRTGERLSLESPLPSEVICLINALK